MQRASSKFGADARGASLIEYVVVVGLLALVALGAVGKLGGEVGRVVAGQADCVMALEPCGEASAGWAPASSLDERIARAGKVGERAIAAPPSDRPYVIALPKTGHGDQPGRGPGLPADEALRLSEDLAVLSEQGEVPLEPVLPYRFDQDWTEDELAALSTDIESVLRDPAYVIESPVNTQYIAQVQGLDGELVWLSVEVTLGDDAQLDIVHVPSDEYIEAVISEFGPPPPVELPSDDIEPPTSPPAEPPAEPPAVSIEQPLGDPQAPSFWDRVGEALDAARDVLRDLLAGAVTGDFGEGNGWAGIAGQVAVGFVPLAGQAADVRDLAAAIQHVREGRDGAWLDVGLATVGFVPGAGDIAKGAVKALRHADELSGGGRGVDELLDDADGIACKNVQACGPRDPHDATRGDHYPPGARVYELTDKHAEGGHGSRMDLGDADATALLNDPVRAIPNESGAHIWAYKDGKVYEFMADATGKYHGFVLPYSDIPGRVPTSVFRAWRDAKLISKAEYNRLVQGKAP